MTGRPLLILALVSATVIGALAAAGLPAGAQAPKRGGVLNAMLGEDPPGLSIHEAATVSTVWPMLPCYSNLVFFDQQKAQETVETVRPELAERWSWQDNYRNLVFFLRKNVRWHDGQPFTSKDVKYTFDVVRGAKDAPAKLRLSPRQDWYVNIEAIETPDPYTVVFKLKRPQPSLQLRQIGVEASMKQIETSAWFPALARRDDLIGANLTAAAIDDPDVYLYENLSLRHVAELHRLLQRGNGPPHGSAVTGAGSRQAPAARLADPAQARGRRGAPDAGLAQRVLHPVALREESRAAPLALQLQPHAGRLAGEVTHWSRIMRR